MEKENTGPGLRSRQANCSSSPIPPLFLIHCTSLVPSFIPDHLLQTPLTLYHRLQWITCVCFLLQTSFPILIAFSQPHLQQVCRGKSMDTSVREACIQTVEFQLWLSCPSLSIPNVVPISVADYLWPPLPFCSQLQICGHTYFALQTSFSPLHSQFIPLSQEPTSVGIFWELTSQACQRSKGP